MSESDKLSLLNIYTVEHEGKTRHLVCFVDTVLGGAVGVAHECIVGEFDPSDDGEFDPQSFVPNPGFLKAIEQFINGSVLSSPDLQRAIEGAGAREQYILDPRFDEEAGAEPEAADVVGAFQIDEAGQIVQGTFRLNAGHLLFDPETGPSGLFSDRTFYDWLHPEARTPPRPLD